MHLIDKMFVEQLEIVFLLDLEQQINSLISIKFANSKESINCSMTLTLRESSIFQIPFISALVVGHYLDYSSLRVSNLSFNSLDRKR